MIDVAAFSSCFRIRALPCFQGFLGFLHLANSGVYTLMWPDVFHRINRRVAQALNHSSCEEVKNLLKQAMKLFRFSRAPFATGRFGQMISEARRDLLQAVVAGKVDDLVDMWMSGVARDRGVADDSFGKHDLIQLLQACARALTKSMASSFW